MLRLARTISGWCAIGGTLSWILGKKRLARNLYLIVGYGGIGACYGHLAAVRGVNVEPWAVLKTRPWTDSEWLRAFAWHAAFIPLAHLVARERP